jgi:hypothetical protein
MSQCMPEWWDLSQCMPECGGGRVFARYNLLYGRHGSFTLNRLNITSQLPFRATFLCPPSKKGGHIALLLSVGRYVGRSVHQQFPFIFFALVAHMVYRFIVRISRSSSILGTIEPFWTELWPLNFEKFQ